MSENEYRRTPINVEGYLHYLKQVRASIYKKYPFVEGCPTKAEAIAKLENLLKRGVKVIT